MGDYVDLRDDTSGRVRRTSCGIHGDDTTAGRCPRCDRVAQLPHTAAADLRPGQRIAIYGGVAATVQRVQPGVAEASYVRVWYVVEAGYVMGSLPGYREVPPTHLFPTSDEPF